VRPLLVDGDQLAQLADSVVRLVSRFEQASSGVATAGAPDAGRSERLAAAVRARADVLARLGALAQAVALAAREYRDVEAGVAAGFGRLGSPAAEPPWRGWGGAHGVVSPRLLALLAGCAPSELESLLVSSPALAATVVASGDRPPAGSDAAALARLLDTGGGTGLRTVHDFLGGLDERRLLVLALLHPVLVASARSAPVAARYAANRVRVAADLHLLLTRIGNAPPGGIRRRLGRAVARRREWLAGSVVLRRADGSVERRRHQLLWFDPRRDGEVVEVIGDLDRAEHLAVFVPGTGSDLRRYPGSLARTVPFAAAEPRLAVVLWQGADFPDQPFDDGVLPAREHVVAAACRDAADRAGPALAEDVAGLRLAAPGPARDVTVLGHSYGGSIVGSALEHGLVADRVVHVASAGTYTDQPHPAGGTAVYSMTAYDDPIRLAQGHDADDAAERLRAMSPPALGLEATGAGAALSWFVRDRDHIGHGADPDVAPGVVRLDTGRFDDSCRLVRGHSGMFTPGSTAWRNLLATMTGGQVQVLEPQRWASHLQPWSLGTAGGHLRWTPPHYVVDRSPWSDPAYEAPTAPTR
jgi:hypothetical protein